MSSKLITTKISDDDINIIDNTYDQEVFLNITNKIEDNLDEVHKIYSENSLCKKRIIRFNKNNIDEFKDILFKNYQKLFTLNDDIKELSDKTFEYEVPEAIISTIKEKAPILVSKNNYKKEISVIHNIKPIIKYGSADILRLIESLDFVDSINISNGIFAISDYTENDLNRAAEIKKETFKNKKFKINFANNIVKIKYYDEINHQPYEYYFSKYRMSQQKSVKGVKNVIQFSSIKISIREEVSDIIRKYVYSFQIIDIDNKDVFDELKINIEKYGIKSF